MKNHRRKRRKKVKALQVHAKDTSGEDNEINPLEEEVKEMKPSDLQFNVVCEDHYRLYERTSVREETRKEGENFEIVLDNGREETKRALKGEPKSTLPPLKERTQRRMQLTFAGRRRACEQILDTQPVHGRNVAENSENTIVPNFSENRKKLASLSFVGIYDLDDMCKTETNKEDNLDNTLKSSKQVDGVGISSDEIAEGVEEASERTKHYVIQTLTLEGQSPLRRKTFFQDKFILPGIKDNGLSTHPRKIFHNEYKTSKRRHKPHRKRENRLPNIVQSENRAPRITPRSYRRKLRAGDNSFEQVYLERSIPRLPLIVNGKMSHS